MECTLHNSRKLKLYSLSTFPSILFGLSDPLVGPLIQRLSSHTASRNRRRRARRQPTTMPAMASGPRPELGAMVEDPFYIVGCGWRRVHALARRQLPSAAKKIPIHGMEGEEYV